MAFIQSKGVYAKEEPSPKVGKQRAVPHFLIIPEGYFKNTEIVSRTVRDSKGYYDPVTRSQKDQEVRYDFLKGNATPVWNEQHVLWLLANLEGTGIHEVAWEPGPDKVEHFHVAAKNASERKLLDSNYRLDQSTEYVTKTYKPVPSVVLRTPADIRNGLKLELKQDERLAKPASKTKAQQIVDDVVKSVKPAASGKK